MDIIRLIPVFLSATLLSAHFLRTGPIPIAVVALLFPAILFFKRAWSARLVQLILVLSAVEWVRTLLHFVAERRVFGQPWIRLAIILGLVAVFTGGSALVFSFSRSLRKRYGLDSSYKKESKT